MKRYLTAFFCLINFVVFSQDRQGALTGEWSLSYIQIESGEPQFNPYYVRNGIEIRMKDDGQNGLFEAHDMCNRANGKYTVPKNGKFIVLELGVTERACTMDWPEGFWKTLQNISSFKIVGDNLYLKYNGDKNLMAFERKEPVKPLAR